MIFTDDGVNLPERLLESLVSDRLVVFVGAGVSMRAYRAQALDSYYPGFKELTRVIAQRLSRVLTKTEEGYLKNGDIDRVLGEWDDQRCDVRSHAAIILQANEAGQRLELHRAIIRLFASNPTPRVVTTNFDHLLIRALEAEGFQTGVKWSVSIAPALPPVRRFSGICYLHGRVDEAQDMVLTDKDIGRAYMDEGWALRFAHSIFQRFDVLFVGYRLEDPPLRYLSLALEGITERELSLAKFFLQDPPSLRDFAKAFLDIDWFDTLFSWGHFDFLLKGVGKWSEPDGTLVERFIDWMLSNPVDLLGKVTEHRSTMHAALFDQFCRRYQDGKVAGVDLTSLRRILEFFRPGIHQRR